MEREREDGRGKQLDNESVSENGEVLPMLGSYSNTNNMARY
jgi:hypothetical protein